jgi:hypothetical protein
LTTSAYKEQLLAYNSSSGNIVGIQTVPFIYNEESFGI